MWAFEMTVSGVVVVLVYWGVVLLRWTRQPGAPPPPVRQPITSLPGDPPFVSILVPARNEVHQIQACVTSLLAQDYPRFEIIVVDDCSEDGTGSILESLAERDARLTVVHGRPVPEGWMGKAHAIYQGYQHAKGTWLLFTDADTQHAPHLLSSVMALAVHSRRSVATVIGDQRNPTFWVYLANLSVFTYIFMFVDLKGWSDPKSRQSLVNGQYLMFWREAYEAVGTHAAVRHYSSTDVSLGYLAKLQGFVPLLIDGRGALQTTMYRSFKEAFWSWSRSLVNGAWTVLGAGPGSLALLVATAALCLFWIGPWVGLVEYLARLDGTGVIGNSLQILAGITLLRIARERWVPAVADGVLMPFAYGLFALMACVGLARAWLYGGTLWKGRVVRTGQRLPKWKPKTLRDLPR